MLKIKYSDHVINRKVKETMGVDMKYNWGTELAKLLSGSVGELVQLVLEGRVQGKRSQGRPRRTWGDDVKEWTKVANIGRAKWTAEKRLVWRTMARNLQIEGANFD